MSSALTSVKPLTWSHRTCLLLNWRDRDLMEGCLVDKGVTGWPCPKSCVQ